METANRKNSVIVKFNPDNNFNPYINGNFEFNVSDVVVDACNVSPLKCVSFWLSMETVQDVMVLQKNNEFFEILAEQLKKDFLNFLINYPKS